MNASGTGTERTTPTLQRKIGEYGSHTTGPLLLCMAGIHGNEPAGVEALQRVINKLEQQQPSISGKFLALRGNLRSLSKKERYIDKDLNRIWLSERIAELSNGQVPESQNAEESEQIELFQYLQELFRATRHEVYFMDLHTTSASSKPFAIFGDTIRNRNFAMHLRTPLILGLEEAIAGTLVEYLTNLGHVAIAFEAGQHDDPDSVEKHEAAVWLALEAAGMISRDDIPDYHYHVAILTDAARGLPRVLEICYRHPVKENDAFKMEPGFVNFQRVRGGQLLAQDRNGNITAPKNFHVFMPLYQGLGDDGFFLARPVKKAWLNVSKALRCLNVDRLLHWFPGVSKYPQIEFAFYVNTKIARLFVIELFHLLGYRRESKKEGILIVSKRKYDMRAPLDHRARKKTFGLRQLIPHMRI